MLDKVKLILRLRNDVFDEELNGLIEACKKDLKIAGIDKIVEDDPLIQRAVILYCKANFGYSDEKGNFQMAYKALRDSLSLAGDYRDF